MAQKNKLALWTAIGGGVLIVLAAVLIFSFTATTKACVFINDTGSGTTVTEEMLKEIDVPAQTPSGFLKTKNQLVGQKLSSKVSANQLIYATDLVSSIEFSNANENDDYIITSINLPDAQAVGGLITTGDVVDIAVIPDDDQIANLQRGLPDYNINSGVNGEIYYILSNVTILDSTSSVAESQGNSTLASAQETTTGVSSNSGSYYTISVSYNDYKKLQLAQSCGKLYMNLSPKQNEDNPPLLAAMSSDITGGLTNAATGELIDGRRVVYSVDANGNITITLVKEEQINNNNDNSNNNDNNNNNDTNSNNNN